MDRKGLSQHYRENNAKVFVQWNEIIEDSTNIDR